MPPSPSVRRSPGREFKADNHKRGRSLEGGILFKDKDEDLALFNEVQNRERDNFLLQSNDDFEDTFSTKLRYFSDHKLGISIPVRGESSNLLNAEEEKNDYDWLLTPPDTPLFTSLDDEVPPLNLPQRGRPRSQPISISRSSTMEKSRRSSRGSASPNRLSPSPKSSSSVVQARGRTSSAPHSSSAPSLRHVSPLRKPSPPPGKPSTPTLRSTTPTPRRVSTSSISNVASSGTRGISPVKSNRGNSASPKVRAWQSNIPGFPSEAPPNLRTSLADRPASYVRGSSPASRNARDFPSKSGRQSMSPTTTRSIGSSHSHDRDRFSSQSKGSVASSGDDDADSLVSIPIGSLEQLSMRRTGSLPNNRAPSFSKKPFRTVASSSAPKRSFDLALRQMDHRKSPQNMFRPLLSSVPSSTLYAGKTSAAQHAITSRNSITTSSNASSDQVTAGEHDTEGSEQNQEDVTSAFVEGLHAPLVDTQAEDFDFDKADALNESIRLETRDGSLCTQHTDLGGSCTVDCDTGSYENHSDHCTAMATVAAPGTSDAAMDHDGPEDMLLCQRCGNMYYATDLTDGELNVCHDCRSDVFLSSNVVTAPISAGNSPVLSMKILEESGSFGITDPPVMVPVSARVTSNADSGTRQHENTIKENLSSYSEPIWDFLSTDSVSGNSVEGDKRHANAQVVGQPTMSYSVPDGDTGGQQMKKSLDYPSVNSSGGAGISVLLNRSSSGKGAFLQSRSFTASSNSYDDSSYVRDSAYSLRSSYGHGSLSASSSVDLGLYRQTEARVQRQLSGKQSDLENYRHDVNTKHRRTGSSLSTASNPAVQTSSLTPGMLEQSPEVSLSQVRNDAVVKLIDAQDQLLSSENMEEDDVCDGESTYKGRTMDASPSESSIHITNKHQLSTLPSFSNSEESSSYENGEDLTNNMKNVGALEASAISLESSVVGEETVPSYSVDLVKGPLFNSQSSLDKISEIETENVHQGSPNMPSDTVSSSSRSSVDELLDPHNTITSDKDITSLAEPDIANNEQGTLEESTVTVVGKGGSKARSLTLEEATDTILFCSSIVHDMAYDAATLAIEKEKSAPLEGSRPMVTVLGKANPERKDAHPKTAVKRTSKPQKAKPKRAESDTKPPSNTGNDENIDVSTNRIVGTYDNDVKSMKAPPKLESKCNCTIM